VLVYADIVLVLCLSFIIGQRLVKLWVERRQGVPGARLHIRFVTIFSLLTIIPSVLMAFFAAAFLHGGLESWFTERNQQALQESLHVAETYFKEHQEAILADAVVMAQLIEAHLPAVIGDEEMRNAILTKFSALKAFSEAIIFDTSLDVIARIPFSYSLEFEGFKRNELEEAFLQNVVLLNKSPEHIRALIGIDLNGLRAFLLVGRSVDPSVITHIAKVRNAVEDYTHALSMRWNLEITFALVFLVVAFSLIFSAIAVALILSSQIVCPIGRLINAAENIKNGDLTTRVRVEEKDIQDELGLLSRTFNEMVEQLQEQRHALLQANTLLEERHRFTESVLFGISSGVISLDAQSRVRLVNKAAENLLKLENSTCVGRLLSDIVPEFTAAVGKFITASARSFNLHETEISFKLSGQDRSFLLRTTPTNLEGQLDGFVVTFDDLTELIAAQKKAAWSDVARRLAHEIKNPLTPVQLSAERLYRKYLSQITTEPDTFAQLTHTIGKQVENIRKLLDEFSLFARLPDPILRPCDLLKICQQTVFLVQTAYPKIQLTCACKNKLERVMMKGDEGLLRQVIINLLQNAACALGQAVVLQENPIIDVEISVKNKEIVVAISDNGSGFPEEHLQRLTDPYVTFSQGGTGLGLAIVKKIVQDHGGSMVLRNRERGAEVRLTFHTDLDKKDV
jgi:two-component system nitrogen regulation sensor histidine kinase NtrY